MTTPTLYRVAVLALLTGLVGMGGSIVTTSALSGWDWLLGASSTVLIISAGIGLIRESR